MCDVCGESLTISSWQSWCMMLIFILIGKIMGIFVGSPYIAYLVILPFMMYFYVAFIPFKRME